MEILYTKDEIHKRVVELGKQITNDYKDKTPIFVCVLTGSFIFMADLVREVNLSLTVDFMSVSSYKNGMVSTGDVEIQKDLTQSIRGRDVIIVEDIVDTGLTLYRLKELLSSRGPSSIRICTLLDKPSSRIKTELVVDYIGFQIPKKFVIGYGLDYAGKYRNLPHIAIVNDNNAI